MGKASNNDPRNPACGVRDEREQDSFTQRSGSNCVETQAKESKQGAGEGEGKNGEKKQDLNLKCAGVSFIKYACLWSVGSLVHSFIPNCGL